MNAKPTTKRRGRPPKDAKPVVAVEAAAPKRRGRPPKMNKEVKVLSAEPKRRGRPSKASLSAKAVVVTSNTVVAKNSYEGLQLLVPSMATPVIESWEFQYPGSKTELLVEIPEFTCVCPKTGLPDFATIVIEYVPNKLCIELKSLKEYVLFYRNLGIFHEHVVNRILKDIAKAVKPRSLSITGIFNSRGGIQTTVTANL